jgi:hypothetical protein
MPSFRASHPEKAISNFPTIPEVGKKRIINTLLELRRKPVSNAENRCPASDIHDKTGHSP